MNLTSREIFREVLSTFGYVLVAIIAFAMLAGFIPFISELLYAIVAFIFIKAAQRMMDKRELPSEACGITHHGMLSGIAWGLGATLITLPFFWVGYVVWETKVMDREYQFDLENYWHWPITMEGEPKGWGERPGVWVWSQEKTLQIGLKRSESPHSLTLTSTSPFVPGVAGPVVIKPEAAFTSKTPQTEWQVIPRGTSRARVWVTHTRDLSVEIKPTIGTEASWPIFKGRGASEVDGALFEATKGLWWILLWVATQFLLIAYPEEYFYRGWMQSRLELAWQKRAEERGANTKEWFGFTPAIFWTSFLFGIGHLLVPIGGVWMVQRMSVFFPSLIFGWLRRKTGSITAPIVYHAFANLMVIFLAVHF